MLDLSTVIPLIVSLLGAFGVGSLIVQWAAGGKDRRAARAAVLTELAAVESARWNLDPSASDGPRLPEAIRRLETAALIARVPRSAVIPYAQLAHAGFVLLQDELELRGEPEFVTGIDADVADLVINAAEIVSRAAWATPATRWTWLPDRVRQLNRQVNAIEDEAFQRKIRSARRLVR